MKIKKDQNYINNILLTFFFMYMIDPFFVNSIASLNRIGYYLLVFLIIILGIFLHEGRIVINRELVLFFTIFGVYFVISLSVSTLLSGEYDYVIELIKLIFKIMSNISLYLVWERLYKSGYTEKNFEEVFVNAIILYVISTFLFIIVPSFKDFWIGFIYNDRQPLFIIQEAGYKTRYGIAGWSSFAEAYMTLFGMILLISLYLRNELSKVEFTVKMIFMLCGSFFYGRYALVVMILILGLFVLFTIVQQRKFWMIRRIFIIAICASLIVLGMYNNQSTKAIIQWAFEPILNYFENGTVKVNSTFELSEMYRLFSPTVKELLVGSGRWYEHDGLPYGYTDVGFMRNIYFGGVGLSLFLYLMDVYLIFLLNKYFSRNSSKSGSIFLSVCLVIILISADLKGNMAVVFIKYVLPMILANICYNKKRKVNNTEVVIND